MQKKMGRPKTDTEAVNVRLTREIVGRIDEARKGQPDLPTRPEMIRRMIEDWLDKDGGS
ncbi:ribbon-helix-helix domain-containing protein [Puniceibacterium sediminis]|uniref:Ribbon-helix-helix protein, copG family n=1 Tax=Puniceibacterium sediminis TaxID=1608407 RepID=A0A238WDZ5_9RHOB|nr:ribbon-helix-helix domain-containing protein [Puniceibacterium sediminis]SNR44800.1 Ribbon-helix-helix protein, copG family [Puniceibacterium sediminis]